MYLIACGKPAGHREVAPRECAVQPTWTPEREAEVKRRRGEKDRAVEEKDRAVESRSSLCRKCLP